MSDAPRFGRDRSKISGVSCHLWLGHLIAFIQSQVVPTQEMEDILVICKNLLRFSALVVLVGMTGMVAAAQTRKPVQSAGDFWGPRYSLESYAQRTLSKKTSGLPALERWNRIAIDASGLDHTPVAPGETRVFGEQLGPCRASRAMAIVHVAMFEAINAIVGKYRSFTGMYVAPAKCNKPIAIAQAAHDTLVVLFPSQKPAFDAELAEDLNAFSNKAAKTNAIALGKTAALSALGICYNDNSNHREQLMNTEYVPSDQPGYWRQDPISLIPIALGSKWPTVRPLVMTSASQFRLPPPPAIDTPEYAVAYNEAKRLGGDGITTPTERTAEQTIISTFWAYDGTPSLCAPPRLYNQIAVQIGTEFHSDDIDMARMLALCNVAMADAGIAAWDSKYFYNYWRPITAIREADPGTGPTGLGDNNPATTGDPTFSPLGAPASNLNGPNFTPPFPAYPSGHATFGAALFESLRNVYGTDNHQFTFVSDEFNGETHDNQGNPRPLIPRTFNTFSQAEEENGQSRIYLGIHWSFDKTGGITQGEQVADYVFANAFQPK